MANTANGEDLPAVFWDEMPSNKDNTDLAAINALIEEQTPAERAESHKVVKGVYAVGSQLDSTGWNRTE